MQKTDFSPRSSPRERTAREAFAELFDQSPIGRAELVYSQLSLYLPRQELARLLVLSEIYRRNVIEANGVLMEFGTCWGRTAALLTNLRGILEPFNFTRRLVIFDTFSGLMGTSTKDGTHSLAANGSYSTGEGYETHLAQVLAYHESEAPISHIRKHEIVKGDASRTLPEYLKRHPETIVAMAYFDFDIHKPTRDCLIALKPHLTRRSVLVFDQLNCPEYPGETLALKEVFGLNGINLARDPTTPWMSYMVCDGMTNEGQGRDRLAPSTSRPDTADG